MVCWLKLSTPELKGEVMWKNNSEIGTDPEMEYQEICDEYYVTINKEFIARKPLLMFQFR